MLDEAQHLPLEHDLDTDCSYMGYSYVVNGDIRFTWPDADAALIVATMNALPRILPLIQAAERYTAAFNSGGGTWMDEAATALRLMVSGLDKRK